MIVTYSYITIYFSHLSLYCRNKNITTDVSDFRSTLDDSSLATYLICRQDSGKEESTYTGSLFSSTPEMVGTPEEWVILMTSKMSFWMRGFRDREAGGAKIIRWSPYMEELVTSNFSSFGLIQTESGSVRKEDRYISPVRELVLNATGSSCVVPAILLYVSSNSEKNDREP